MCIFAIFVRLYWAYQQNELDQDEYYTVLVANNKTAILGNNFKDYIDDFKNISGKELYKIIFFGDKSVKDCLDDIITLYKKNIGEPNLYYSLFRLSFIGREVIDKKNIIMTGTILNCLFFIISFIFIYKLLKYVFEDKREIILGSIFCISLMPSSITFAMFLRAYQIQENFFIVITYIVLSTISENKYSIKNFILTTIIAGICYITQFSSLLFVLILSAMLFYNFLISNKEKFSLNNLPNLNISNGIKNILIKVWLALIIIFVVSISILFILGARYRNSYLNIISENDFGDYKHIYARINFKNQLFRANDLYQIKNVNINGDKVLDYNFHYLVYINLKVKNHVPNNFSVSYNLKFNDKIYEIPIVLFTVIFLILFYKIGSNNLEIKNYKIIIYYAGTGKSSTVKAVANFFKDEGLRLIEIKKNQLHFITDIIEKLSCSPLKFIIFIDDLTFSSNDDTFSYLKAILEGGVNSFPNNIAVYVTSNYRHLIKENFTDRTGDDIHIEDTIQQIMSLTNRFGMIITFQRPGRDLFK